MPCDTFVVLSTSNKHGVFFGKNSDRPSSEVQEVTFHPRECHPKNTIQQCTYIAIDGTESTNAVILSKPGWMWGAEMGANEHNVCIGNEAVWTRAQNKLEDEKSKLLGMDLVRLALERASTAVDALDVITHLLETHGQGGACFIDPSRQGITYHNSFLIADPCEAWVLETVGTHWAAEKCTGGYRNISNELSIGTVIDRKSRGLEEYARDQGWWDGQTPFNFKDIFSIDPGLFSDKFKPCNRFTAGRALLQEKTDKGDFDLQSMMSVLRDEASGICQTGGSGLGSVSTGSQVSVLHPHGSVATSHHWFTATPNPNNSLFKPFMFVPGASGSGLTTCVARDNCAHALYQAHAQMKPCIESDVTAQKRKLLRQVEAKLIARVHDSIGNTPESKDSALDTKDVFHEAVKAEMSIYE